MESWFQYRRLRREAEEDLANSQAKSVRTSTSAPSLGSDPEAGVAEKPAVFDDAPLLPGVEISQPGDNGEVFFVVGWRENDPSNPLNWSLLRKWMVMLTCCLVAIAMTVPSSVEGATQDAFDAHFGVNAMAGSMTTGTFILSLSLDIPHSNNHQKVFSSLESALALYSPVHSPRPSAAMWSTSPH
jgi:hypothetical protein